MGLLDSLFGNRDSYLHSVIAPLIAMALIDGNLNENEFKVIAARLRTLGVSEEHFRSLLKSPPSALTLPPTKDERVRTLVEVCLVMLADGKVDDREMSLVVSMGAKFGLSPQETAACLYAAKEISSEVFPGVDAHGEIMKAVDRHMRRSNN